MEMGTYTRRLWALWLALPATALTFWLAGNHLPARIAMHYDASGRPDSWASSDEVRSFALGFLAVMLVVVTAVGHLVAYLRQDRAKPALVLLYVVVGLVWALQSGFVWYQVTR